MRITFSIILATIASHLFAQNKKTIFYDSAGQVTTFEGHWAQVVTGKYKSVYNKPENKKTLVKTTPEEFKKELNNTRKRITKTAKLGTDFPDFDLTTIDGDRLTKADSKGKVIVVNFWFIGCAPCEMERPALNDLRKLYQHNPDVVFISIARNTKEQLNEFLPDNPVLYTVVPADKGYIESTFDLNQFPVNLVIDRQGKYSFNGMPTGIGIVAILQDEIEKALAK